MAIFCLLVLAIISALEAARIPSSWYGRQSREAGMNPDEGKLYWHFVICMKLRPLRRETMFTKTLKSDVELEVKTKSLKINPSIRMSC